MKAKTIQKRGIRPERITLNIIKDLKNSDFGTPELALLICNAEYDHQPILDQLLTEYPEMKIVGGTSSTIYASDHDEFIEGKHKHRTN